MTERVSQVDVLRSGVLSIHGSVVAALDALGATLRGGERPALLGIRKAFQSYARLSAVAQPFVLGLNNLSDHTTSTAASLAHVGALASLMARRAGMAPAIQRDVGVAASLSSVARLLDPGLGALGPDERIERGLHNLSARWLSQVPGLDPFKDLLVIVARQQADREGRVGGHLVSQMTAVADRFSARRGEKKDDGSTPSAKTVIEELSASADVSPAAVRLLELTIGTYPVGTAVRLSTGELAIVVAPSTSIHVEDPRVAIMRERSGQVADGRIIDTSASGSTITDIVEESQLRLGAGELMLF